MPGSGLSQLTLFAVRINDQDFGDALLMRAADGTLLVSKTSLEAWRMNPPETTAVMFEGEPYYPLTAYQGGRLNVDENLLQLSLELPPRYFTLNLIGNAQAIVVPPPPKYTGGFGNYDLFYNKTDGSGGTSTLNGTFEAGIFNQYGAGVTGFLAQDMGSDHSRMIRLDSTWTRDFPGEIKTLTMGDTIGNSGTWGRPVRFGGVRYGTNFATQPGFIKFPLPGLSGEAALPSTTELYVNGILRQSGTLPPGPFQINNLPVVTGDGNVKVVVRDLMGREQVISQPYYASTLLLRKGLAAESNEIGFVRNNYGIDSNDYGRFVVAAQRSKGFTDSFTGEARVEAVSGQQTAGLGGSLALPAIGIFSIASAASHSNDGYGGLLLTSYERQSATGLSFGIRSQSTTPQFAQMGLQPGQQAPARVTSANVGFSTGRFGSLGVSYVLQDNRSTPDNEIISANYSMSVGKSSALIVSAYKTLTGESNQALSITLSVGFGERSSASLNHVAQKDSSQTVAQVQQNLPAGTGTGYRLLAAVGDPNDRQEAGFSVQNDIGTYVVEAGHGGGITSYRASASGGVAFLGGRTFLSRRISNSFGVVQVPDFRDVRSYCFSRHSSATAFQAGKAAFLDGNVSYT